MLSFSPAAATKDPKKDRTACGWAGEDGSQDEGMEESDICHSINTADIHEIVVTRVNETLTAYKNAQREFDSPVITHTHTHTRTHARTHARTHTHTQICSACEHNVVFSSFTLVTLLIS